MSNETTTPKTARELLVEKYNALKAKRDEIDGKMAEVVKEVSAIDDLNRIVDGSAVIIKIGKGDTAKEVTGTVTGVKTDEAGEKSFKVAYGSGFDTDVAVVKAGRIRLVPVEAQPENA